MGLNGSNFHDDDAMIDVDDHDDRH